MQELGLKKYYFRSLLSGTEWLKNVCLEITSEGIIHSLTPNKQPSLGEPVFGVAIPGMPNVHSHAFQRGFAGLSEFTLNETGESFWTWRELMYKFANSLDDESMTVIASQAYIEMLKAGYTAVGEFHYLHNKKQNKALEMAKGILKAGQISGIAVTLLPVLYQVSDFLKDTPNELQKPFINNNKEFNLLIQQLSKIITKPNTLGMAFHSLRAVPIVNFKPVLEHIKSINPLAPIHIHVSEQVKEVESCLVAHNKTPIEFLFSEVHVDNTWCLIHATQATEKELELMKKSGCFIGICPTTEANLGDGVFPAKKYQAMQGDGICIGSDSQISIDPVQELKQLEYSQRLWEKARVVLINKSKHNGTDLWFNAAYNGAKAIGQPIGILEVGKRADLVILNDKDVIFAGTSENEILDAMIFASRKNVVKDVMVNGKWVVVGGRHVNEEEVEGMFMELVKRIVEKNAQN